MKIALSILGSLMLTTAVSATPCPLTDSVYRDRDDQGFELVFGDPIPQTGSSRAIATITHPKNDELYRFNLTQSSGYGSFFMVDRDTPESATSASLRVNFFDQHLRSASLFVTDDANTLPIYIFIAGLGSYDYYERRGTITDDTAPLLLDAMWVYDRCQSAE